MSSYVARIFGCDYFNSYIQLYSTILDRLTHAQTSCKHKKLSYRRGTARCVVSVKVLPIATQQCRNYLYDKS